MIMVKVCESGTIVYIILFKKIKKNVKKIQNMDITTEKVDLELI